MNDLRSAVRSLRATPIVTSVAVLSLALGIGATTVIFSIANSRLRRKLPVRDPGALVPVTDPTPCQASERTRLVCGSRLDGL
jgi:hypothetical protein